MLSLVNNTANYASDYPLDTVYNDNVGYTETLAYRVEKIGGKPTGDLRTQKVLQNYWFMNTDTQPEMDLIDTQVKYGKYYQYELYAFDLVYGSKFLFRPLPLGLFESSFKVGVSKLVPVEK